MQAAIGLLLTLAVVGHGLPITIPPTSTTPSPSHGGTKSSTRAFPHDMTTTTNEVLTAAPPQRRSQVDQVIVLPHEIHRDPSHPDSIALLKVVSALQKEDPVLKGLLVDHNIGNKFFLIKPKAAGKAISLKNLGVQYEDDTRNLKKGPIEKGVKKAFKPKDVTRSRQNRSTKDVAHSRQNRSTKDVAHSKQKRSTKDVAHSRQNRPTKDVAHSRQNLPTKDVAHSRQNRSTKDVAHSRQILPTKDVAHSRQKRFSLRNIALPLSIFHYLGFLPMRVPGLPYHVDPGLPDYTEYEPYNDLAYPDPPVRSRSSRYRQYY